MNEGGKDEFEEHQQLIQLFVNRISHFKTDGEKYPLLCLDFFKPFNENLPFNLPDTISIDDLKTAKPYALILSAISQFSPGNEQNPKILFSKILDFLAKLGYRAASECTDDGLIEGNQSHHVALSLLLEWLIIDKSLTIDFLCQDLKRLPRSFYIFKDRPQFLIDAVALWLSKFPSMQTLPEIKNLEEELMNGQHVAAVLSRVFPNKIQKDKIKVGANLTQNDIESNWKLIQNVADDLKFFIPPRRKISQQLVLIFVADIFSATRPAAKKFIKLDKEKPIELLPMPEVKKKPPEPLKQYLPPKPFVPKPQPVIQKTQPVVQKQQTKKIEEKEKKKVPPKPKEKNEKEKQNNKQNDKKGDKKEKESKNTKSKTEKKVSNKDTANDKTTENKEEKKEEVKEEKKVTEDNAKKDVHEEIKENPQKEVDNESTKENEEKKEVVKEEENINDNTKEIKTKEENKKEQAINEENENATEVKGEENKKEKTADEKSKNENVKEVIGEENKKEEPADEETKKENIKEETMNAEIKNENVKEATEEESENEKAEKIEEKTLKEEKIEEEEENVLPAKESNAISTDLTLEINEEEEEEESNDSKKESSPLDKVIVINSDKEDEKIKYKTRSVKRGNLLSEPEMHPYIRSDSNVYFKSNEDSYRKFENDKNADQDINEASISDDLNVVTKEDQFESVSSSPGAKQHSDSSSRHRHKHRKPSHQGSSASDNENNTRNQQQQQQFTGTQQFPFGTTQSQIPYSYDQLCDPKQFINEANKFSVAAQRLALEASRLKLQQATAALQNSMSQEANPFASLDPRNMVYDPRNGTFSFSGVPNAQLGASMTMQSPQLTQTQIPRGLHSTIRSAATQRPHSHNRQRMAKSADQQEMGMCLGTSIYDGFNDNDTKAMADVLRDFYDLPPTLQTMDQFKRLIRDQYGRNADEDHIKDVTDTLLTILKRVLAREDSLPRMLIDISAKLLSDSSVKVSKSTQVCPIEDEEEDIVVVRELKRDEESAKKEQNKCFSTQNIDPFEINEHKSYLTEEVQTENPMKERSSSFKNIIIEEEEEEDAINDKEEKLSSQQDEEDKKKNTAVEEGVDSFSPISTQTEKIETNDMTLEDQGSVFSYDPSKDIPGEERKEEKQIEIQQPNEKQQESDNDSKGENISHIEDEKSNIAGEGKDINELESNFTFSGSIPAKFSKSSSKQVDINMKNATIMPNLRVAKLALTFNLMPGDRLASKRNELIEAISGFPNDRIIFLLSSIDLKYKGVYILDEKCVRASKFKGKGPTIIGAEDIGRFMKFNTSSKAFDPFPSKNYTQTTDAVSLKRTVEPQSW